MLGFAVAALAVLLLVSKPLPAPASDFLDVNPVAVPPTTNPPATAASPTARVPKASPPPILSTRTNAPAAASAGAQSDISSNAMAALDDKYKLAAGDRVNYQVLEDGDDPKSLVVSDSGDLEVPYLGPYPAAGKTCRQLADELKVILEKKYYYQATVIISVDSMVSQGVIYLVGAVKSPGPLELPRDEVLTVSKAILRAGGFTDFANQKEVRVTRKQETGTNDVFTVNVSDVLDKGETAEDQAVEAGDLIFVPEKTINF